MMRKDFVEPEESDSIECHLQEQGTGTLICRAAKTTGQHSTNEVDPTVCFNCPTGKIYREVGCDSVSPQLYFIAIAGGGVAPSFGELFCKRRKRYTDPEYCASCPLVTAETTRVVVSTARGLFQTGKFYSAYKDLEKAREALRDGNLENVVTRSIAAVESVLIVAHERRNANLPEKKAISDLWKSARGVLRLEELDAGRPVDALLSSLTGVVQHVGALRNATGDAHGRGTRPPNVSPALAELALNAAATVATMVVRRLEQLEGS